MHRTTLVVFSLLVATAACGPPEPAPTQPSPPAEPAATGPRAGGTLVMGVLADLENWNPYLTDTAFSENLLALLYPTLAVEQVDYRNSPPSFEPALAESWKRSADGLEITFQLRPEAVWSDGVPVTAADVVFSWKAQISPEVAWFGADVKEFIERVEALDDHTVRFRFTRDYPYQLMDANDSPIVPAHVFGAVPFDQWDRTNWKEVAVSAGPFKLESHQPQQEIVVVRNPTFWREGLPYLDRIVWRIIPDQTNLLTQLRTGAIDFIEGVPPREAEHVRQHPRLELVMFPSRVYGYLGWNTRHEFLNQVPVRRALTMAIDRKTILDTVHRGFARPSLGPILSSMWAFNQDLKPLPQDIEAARRLLAEAGWRDSDGDGVLDRRGEAFELELMTNAGNEVREDICLLVQTHLARVGVKITPRFIEWGAMQAKLQQGDFVAYVSGWAESTQVDMGPIWGTPDPEWPGYNYVAYSNQEVDRLVAETERIADFGEQKTRFDRIQEIIVEEQPYTFLYEGLRLTGLNSRVKGAIINDATPFFNLEEWYVVEPAGGASH